MKMNKKIFREYDIRGVYPVEIDEKTAYIIGKSYGSILQTKYNKNICTVGYDNRLSSPSLHKSMVQGLIDTGLDIIDLGLVTTPMLYYAAIKFNTLGIMITASHNPKDDNGFKFSFDKFGNARGKQIYDFRDFTLKDEFLVGKGHIYTLDILPYYKSLFKDNIFMGDKKLKIVIDSGNGTTANFAYDIYHQFSNLDITMINEKSYGTFPNHHPDPAVPENLKQLQAKVLEIGADIGIAFDGDGDRVGFVDNMGNIVPADKFLCILMRYYLPNYQDKRVLYDVKCSKIISDTAKTLGIKDIMYRTGASYTRSEIVKEHIPFGGEYSGHIIFNDRFKGFDSGIYAGLRMLEILSNSNTPLSHQLDNLTKYYNTPEIKVPTPDEIKFQVIDKVISYAQSKNYNCLTIDGLRVNNPNSWALVRASNTGPNITLRFEATTKEELESLKKEFTNLVEEYKKDLSNHS